MIRDAAPIPEPKEIRKGIYRSEVRSDRDETGEIIASMPDFGYMVWTKDGQSLSDEIVQKKITDGALVVNMLPGLDSDAEEFNELALKIFNDYKGDKELLITGLAHPGFWRQQYGKDFQMNIADVSVYKYILMVLEFAKKMGLSKKNTLMIGHSAGGEAAVWLSKWFKVIGLSAALHEGEDATFSVIKGANAIAVGVSGATNKLDTVVSIAQKGIIALFSGSRIGSPLHSKHMERLLDGAGKSHDLKVIELCQKDAIPPFLPDPDNLLVMGGEKDILTSKSKLEDWLNSWFSSLNYNVRGEVLNRVMGWFPTEISRRLRHDSILTDEQGLGVVSQKAVDLLENISSSDQSDPTREDLEMLDKLLKGFAPMDPESIKKELERLSNLRRGYTLNSNYDMGMLQYLNHEIYQEAEEFLKFVSSYKKADTPVDDNEFREWLTKGDGRSRWLGLAAKMLGYAKDSAGQQLFDPKEIELIRSGKLDLKDQKIRARVAMFPLRCEWGGWMAIEEMQDSTEFRGRGSRGDTLDPALYEFTDTILRRLAGMDASDESVWELMASPLGTRIASDGLFGKFKTWNKKWMN